MEKAQKGIAIILVLVFAAVFTLAISALVGFIFTQAQLGASKETREKALGIAEAGLAYYHWFLTHNPGDIQDGTGTSGPYVHAYNEPGAGQLGSYSLSIAGNEACGVIQSIDVTSTGEVAADTAFKRTVFGRHAKPSVAEYSYIIGESVWAGSDRNITGPYHSNGGIRMDGTNNSLVTSAVANWSCNSSFGCSPTQTQNGVFGAGSGSVLWQFPANSIDFNDMAADFSELKGYAQANGVYLAPYSSTEINYGGYMTATNGYHLVFNSDGTVDIYQVTNTGGYWGYRSGIGWTPDFHIINAESFIERRAIPSSCSLIYVEDKVWIEGTVKGKVTVVAADVVNNYDPDVILEDNIDYSAQDGSDGLTVISENGIYIPPQSPDNLSLKGIFVAQGDRFGRPYYSGDTKSQLTMSGSIVSLKRVGTSWSCSGSFCSGYANRENSYDRLQTTNPPPFTPASTTTPQYILWREM
tara:strand:+ start:5599 stop:7002 length:1404 start_codon:yes stop_codon:yes gene_type:complete